MNVYFLGITILVFLKKDKQLNQLISTEKTGHIFCKTQVNKVFIENRGWIHS
jgi:hypothetical protein